MQETEVKKLSPKIAVIGVGGAGGNAVNNMISSNLDGCEFLVCNTDAQALGNSLADDKVQLGVNVTGGLGAGSKPEVGEAAAQESLDDVLRYLDGANMAFVTAGMGGGTGTGAAPVIAKACRQQGILTVGVVTKPFHFEGVHRMEQAEAGIKEMQQYVDTLIVIPNQNLFRIANEKTTFAEAFKMADTVLQSGVRGVTDLMVRPGLVNLDFADIRTAMSQMGKAMMGTGEASGEKRAVEAAESAINNPLLDDVSMKGANGVIINVTGGYDMTLFEADEACNRIRDEVDPSANIIFGATFDDSMDGFMRVSIVATGIEGEAAKLSGSNSSTGSDPRGGSRKSFDTNGTQQQTSSVMRSAPSVVRATSSAPSVAAKRDDSPVSMSGREIMQNLTAPASRFEKSAPISKPPYSKIPLAQGSGENEADISSADMFEQGEFVATNSGEDETALRGTTYNNSFIPPKPMEPDVKVPESGIGSHISSFHGSHISKDKAEAESSNGLHLTPPKIPTAPVAAPAQKQQRAPSLFERITGSVQNRIDSLREDNSETDKKVSSPPKSEVKRAVGDTPVQGSLIDVTTPAGKPAVKLDDELDIPAFLRRQAN